MAWLGKGLRLALALLLVFLAAVYCLVLAPFLPTSVWIWVIAATQIAGWGYVIVRKVRRRGAVSPTMGVSHAQSREGLL